MDRTRKAAKMTEYPIKTELRALGCYPMSGRTEEQTSFILAMQEMEALMDGKETMHACEGVKLPLEDAAEIAADSWDTDKDELIASRRRWDAMTPEERARSW